MGALLASAAWGGAGTAFGLTAPVSAGPTKEPKIGNVDFDGFFPYRTRIHAGDSVSFTIGGFHTVTFLAKGQALPPFIITSPSTPISGQLDASGNPFWFNGKPTQIINPLAGAPAGPSTLGASGSAFVNSGLPGEGPPKPFVVKFSKAGVYVFHCIVHPGMQGTVTVDPKNQRVPSAAQDERTANKEDREAVKQAKRLAKVHPPSATVLAGHDAGPVAWLRFFPQNLTVKKGTTVEFKVSSKREAHTITFGPAAYTEAVEKSFIGPVPGTGSPPAIPPTTGINPTGGYPSDPLPLPPFTGTNHGNGFEGSGILSLGAPGPSSVKIKFTKAGVYNFECVLHKGMDGKVTVTQ